MLRPLFETHWFRWWHHWWHQHVERHVWPLHLILVGLYWLLGGREFIKDDLDPL